MNKERKFQKMQRNNYPKLEKGADMYRIETKFINESKRFNVIQTNRWDNNQYSF